METTFQGEGEEGVVGLSGLASLDLVLDDKQVSLSAQNGEFIRREMLTNNCGFTFISIITAFFKYNQRDKLRFC